MSRETTVTFVDDFDGSKGTERNPVSTHVFAWHGQNYEIDLTAKNAEVLEQALVPFILKARQITRLRASATAAGGVSNGTAARQWAKDQKDENGQPRYPDLSDRGKLPDNVLADYLAAQNPSTDGSAS